MDRRLTEAGPGLPCVSIVIPTFNRARLVSRAIESVFEQNVANLEVLVVDDGSTDETAEALGRFARLPVSYRQLTANMGVGHARQVAIERAQGKYLALLDSDDVWLPGKLDTQIAVLEQHPKIDLVFTDYLHIEHQTSRAYSAFSRVRENLSTLRVHDVCHGARVIEDGLPAAIMAVNFIGTSTLVARRTAVNRVGGFDPRLRTAGDLELCWRLILAGATFAFVDRIFVHRHRDETSLTAAAGFTPSSSRAVAVCHAAAVRTGRDDLARHVRERQYRMWYEFFRARIAEGRRLNALLAFVRNLKYAATFRTCLVAFAAVFGPAAIRRLPRPV